MQKIISFLKILGPGLITGASDDDPSGIATYSQTGAQFGYQQLWGTLWTIPLMTTMQEMSGRIGIVTGKGIGGVLKQYYPKPVLYIAMISLLIANIINIGADLGAITSAAKLLIPLPTFILLIATIFLIILTQIFIPYKTYEKYLKWLAIALLTYIVETLILHQDWLKILKSTLIPYFSFNKDYLINLTAFLGTTISPYLFFWQSNQEVEKRIALKRQKSHEVNKSRVSKKDIFGLRIDTIIGMTFSNLIAFFIIASTASILASHGITSINTASEAAQALKPLAGNFAYILFALGVIGAGLLAIPVLAGSASYAVSSTFSLKEGLGKKLQNAPVFYGIIIASIILGALVNFTPIPPFKLLYYSAAVNGLASPFLIVLILLIVNNKQIMGKHTNPKLLNILGIITALLMGITSIALLYSLKSSV